MNETPPSPSTTESSAPPAPEASWKDLGLSQAALDLIEKAGFKSPTGIQTQSIPLALEGHDLIASAQTGSGKTAAFVLPLVEKFAGREGTFGLILAPTREIAQQIHETIKILGAPRGVRSIVLIGGIDMKLDKRALDEYPQIIVATPGRLCDHLDRGNVWLDFIRCVVLDEADRMLDMGFSDQLSRIMQDVPAERQTMIFSATFAPTVEALARRILNQPKRIAIGKPSTGAPTIDQKLIWMSEDAKARELMRLIQSEPGKIIVFSRSKDGAADLWRTLHGRGVHDVTFITSDRLQSVREQALAQFKDGTFRILIATDVAGRGIHVEDVALVVNYDLPMEAEDYIHRIGRTGRKGTKGKAIAFATTRNRGIVQEIEKLLGHKIAAEVRDGVDLNAPRDSGHGRGGRGGHGGRGGRDRRPSNGGHSASGSSNTQNAPRIDTRPVQAMGAAPLPPEGGAPGPGGGGGKRRRRRRGGAGRGPKPAPTS